MRRDGPRRGRRIQQVAVKPGTVDPRLIPHFDAAFGPGRSAVRSDRPMKSKFIDAFDLFHAYSGVRTKHTRVTFELLRRMARQCEPMSGILHLRCNQAGNFAKRPQYETDTGFKITTRDRSKKIKGPDKKEIERLTDFLLYTGFSPNPERRDNFDTFIRKLVRDSLVLDAYAFEIVPGNNPRKFPIAEVWAIDAATIRMAEEEYYQAQVYPDDQGDIAFVQEIDGRIVAEYTHDEIGYGVRNPTTELEANGYGVSELEEGINLITSILLATQFNRAYFSNNSTPRGYLTMLGNYSAEQLEGFKRQWRQQLEGAANAWRTPIMAFDGDGELKWTALDDKSHRDMEYHLWLDWLTNVLCSLYCVNPSELGFKGYQPQGPSLSDGSQEKQMEQGEDKGLLPLMINLGNTLNSQIIWRLNEDFSLEWSGLRADDRMQQQQWYLGWLNGGVMTVNEVRTEALDMKEIEQEWAEDAPANATLAGIYSQGKAAEQQAAMPGAATAGGPMMPPNANLQPGGGDKPGEPGQPQPPNAGGQPPAGQPPQPGPGGPPQMGTPPNQPPKPFGKSLEDPTEIIIETE